MRLRNINPLLLLLAIHQTSATLTPRQNPTTTTTTKTSTPSTAPEFISPALFQSAILNRTNSFRTQHDAPPVSYNSTLADFASSHLTNKTNCEFEHSDGPYGENLAIGCSDVSGCVDMWGDERDEYNFKKPGFERGTGHFTQLVWRNTTDVGCGRKWCGERRRWYLVCEYWPRGNIIGEFGEMVHAQVNGGVSRTKVLLVTKMVALWMGVFILMG